jgi:uncharacterized protein YcbX
VRIVEIAYSPVKSLALLNPPEVDLSPTGLPANRRFYLMDEQHQMLNGKRLGGLVQVSPDFDPATNRLTLRFPDRSEISDTVRLADPVQTSFFGRLRPGRLVDGPWSAALSDFAGQPLRLVAAEEGQTGVDRGVAGGVTIASLASLQRLAQELHEESIDRRRFRMLFWIDAEEGLAPHAEDAWVGCRVRLGESAVVELRGHVGRCAVTTQNPRTGIPDLDTLAGLKAYRGEAETTAPLALGVFGEVVTPGRVRLGDRVSVDGPADIP